MIHNPLDKMLSTRLSRTVALLAAVASLTATSASAIPVFARKYQTTCATCHTAFPKLNYFGKAFKNNGYRYPEGTDEEMTREKPVSLGAEAYKKLWPNALWPANIAGSLPIGVRGVMRVNEYENSSRNQSFEFPHELELLAAGTIGDTFSYFGEVEMENEDNVTELATVVVLQYDPRPDFHVRIGEVSPHPIADGLRLTASHYNPYDVRTTPGSLNLRATNPANPAGPQLSISSASEEDRWRLRDGQAGIELWGSRNGAGGNGGLTWAAGIANGQGLNDANGAKDVYARVAYKFSGYGELGGGASPEGTEFWRDDSFKAGLFAYKGTSTNVFVGSTVALDPSRPAGVGTVEVEKEIENDFDVVGAEFDWWFKDLNVYGLYAQQSDDDPRGTGEAIDSKSWFVEGDWTIYPWLVGILRYGQTSQDFAVRADPDTQKFLVPAIVFVARANVKFTAEAQMRLDDAGKGNDVYVLAIDFGF
ncbi:MAG: hypothetical protein AAB011_13710 [Candidatus Eisenbacteria bacterium]